MYRCEKLCDLIWITRSQIKEADRFRVNLGRYFELPQSCEIINTLLDMTTQYLSSLVARYNVTYNNVQIYEFKFICILTFVSNCIFLVLLLL